MAAAAAYIDRLFQLVVGAAPLEGKATLHYTGQIYIKENFRPLFALAVGGLRNRPHRRKPAMYGVDLFF